MERPADLRKWIASENRFWDQSQQKQSAGRRVFLWLVILLLLYLLRSFFGAFSFQ